MLAQRGRRSGGTGGRKRKRDRQARKQGRFLAVKLDFGELIERRQLRILHHLLGVLDRVVGDVVLVEDLDPVRGRLGA